MDRVTICLGFPGILLIYVSQVVSNGTLFTVKNVPVWAINYILTLVTEDRGNFLSLYSNAVFLVLF